MPVWRRRGFEASLSAVTDEAVYHRRREILRGLSLAAGGLGLGAIGARAATTKPAPPASPAGKPVPAVKQAALPPGVSDQINPAYQGGRAMTAERDATTYNNYYEIATDKDVWQAAQKIPQRPWTLRVGGLCGKPRTWDIDTLLRMMPVEERIYRHRCVEAWAMTVPWSGFALSHLIAAAEPKPEARYVRFTTLADPGTMPGLSDPTFPWPYVEGLTMEEAGNELAFLGTGLYGRAMPPQDGGPIRLVLPWKYGFKSAKAIVAIEFVRDQPMNFWQAINPDEYGFWANVNPAVPHPRWSQASERLLGTGEMVPTVIYNGYGSFVAGLYSGLGKQKLFM